MPSVKHTFNLRKTNGFLKKDVIHFFTQITPTAVCSKRANQIEVAETFTNSN